MADETSPRSRFVVEHSNIFQPEDLCRFIHLDGFEQDWKELELNDDELCLLQIQIMASPLGYPVIPQTSGIRKLHFSPPPENEKKRKSIEVLYAMFSDFSVVVLAAANRMGGAEELSLNEKLQLRTILEDIEEAL